MKNVFLSMEGEELAKKKASLLPEMSFVFSSNYVRAMATAKYFAKEKPIHIMKEFRERKQGIQSWDELPSDFETRQFQDWDYKIGDGESLNEVKKRITAGLYEILSHMEYTFPILIVSHATALSCLLSNWCEIQFDSYTFQGMKKVLNYF